MEDSKAMAAIAKTICEGLHGKCDKIGTPTSSRTMYSFDGIPGSAEDPNKPVVLCKEYSEDHHAQWDEKWADYYRDLL